MSEQVSIEPDREDALFLVSLVLNNAEYEDEDEAYYRQVASTIISQIPH